MVDLRVPTASAMQAKTNFQIRICQPMASALPVCERRLREVAVLWAALGQAVACQYLLICGTEIKAQGCVENLIRGGGGDGGWLSRLKTRLALFRPLLRSSSGIQREPDPECFLSDCSFRSFQTSRN